MAMYSMRVEEKAILRDYRDKLGLTQQQVADKARIQLRQYQRFEAGERNLSSSSFDIACRVIEALGLDPTKYHHGEYCWGDEVVFSPEGLRRAEDGMLWSEIKYKDEEEQVEEIN